MGGAASTLYPVGIDHHDLIDSDAVGEPGELTREELLDALVDDAERAYAERETQLEEIAGDGAMRQLERNVLLNVLDRKWREHLYEMDYLKEGIGLRAMAQRDPLVEYQREGYDMFVGMLDGLKEESVGLPVQRQVEAAPAPAVAPVAAPAGLAEFAAQAGQPGPRRAPSPPRNVRRALRAKGIEDDAPPLTYTGRPRTGRRRCSAPAAAPSTPHRPAPVGVSGARPRVSSPGPPRTAAGDSLSVRLSRPLIRTAGRQSASGHGAVRSGTRWRARAVRGCRSRTPRPASPSTTCAAGPGAAPRPPCAAFASTRLTVSTSAGVHQRTQCVIGPAAVDDLQNAAQRRVGEHHRRAGRQLLAGHRTRQRPVRPRAAAVQRGG